MRGKRKEREENLLSPHPQCSLEPPRRKREKDEEGE